MNKFDERLDDLFNNTNFYEKDGFGGYQVNKEFAKEQIRTLILEEVIGEDIYLDTEKYNYTPEYIARFEEANEVRFQQRQKVKGE